MCKSKSFMPTIFEVYLDSRANMTVRPEAALRSAHSRLAIWREAFPDTVSPNKLARFLLAKEATGARLNRLTPAWVKPHLKSSAPKPRVFVPGLPPRFRHGLGKMNPNALHFHNRSI